MTPEELAGRATDLVGTRCRPVTILSERGGSLVLLLAAGRRWLVAKAGTPAAAARAAAAQTAVAGALAGKDADLRVPRIVGHDPAVGVVVMTRCSGSSLADRLRSGDLPAVRRAGAAVAALQTVDPPLGPVTGLRDHLAELVRPGIAAWTRDQRLGSRAGRLLAALLHAEPQRVPLRTVHRDLHPRQLLVADPEVTLLDWEYAGTGDPAFDVGNLCGYLRARLTGDRAAAAVAAFRSGYADGDRVGALHRTAIFEAFTYVRLAVKAAREHTAAADAAVDRLLAAGERLIQGTPHGAA